MSALKKLKDSSSKIFNLKGKTAVFIDYANIKSWAKENGLSFDMEVLYQTLTSLPVAKILLYYGTDPKNVRSSAFLTKMRNIGFEVITKSVKYFKVSLLNLLNQRVNQEMLEQLPLPINRALISEAMRLEKQRIYFLSPKANFDVEISLDMVLFENRFDTFVLFSGDSDFLHVVNYLRSKGKRFIVISGKKYLAGDLAKAADGFLFLDELRFKVKDLFKNHIPPKRDREKSNITLPRATKPVKRLTTFVKPI